MNESLKQRLAGALVLIAAAFILSLLLPKPGTMQTGGDSQQVTIDLSKPDTAPVVPPATETPVPPVIAAPEKIAAASDLPPGADDDAAPKIEEPPMPANAPAMNKPAESAEASVAKPGKTPAAETAVAPKVTAAPKAAAAAAAAPAKPAPKVDAAKPGSVPKAVLPAPATAQTAASPETSPHAPVLKLEPTLKHEQATTASKTPPVPPAKPTAQAQAKAPPVAAKPATTPADKRWYVQAGAFNDVVNARQALTKLNGGGLKGIISPADTAAGTRYRVRVGPYATRDQAKAAQQRMAPLGFSGSALAED